MFTSMFTSMLASMLTGTFSILTFILILLVCLLLLFLWLPLHYNVYLAYQQKFLVKIFFNYGWGMVKLSKDNNGVMLTVFGFKKAEKAKKDASKAKDKKKDKPKTKKKRSVDFDQLKRMWLDRKDLLSLLKHSFVKLIRALHISISGRVQVGVQDGYLLGRMLGFYHMTRQTFLLKNIILEPKFNDEVLNGELRVTGCLRLGELVLIMLQAVFAQPVRGYWLSKITNKFKGGNGKNDSSKSKSRNAHEGSISVSG